MRLYVALKTQSGIKYQNECLGAKHSVFMKNN